MNLYAANDNILVLVPVVNTSGLELDENTKKQLAAEQNKKPLPVLAVGPLVQDPRLVNINTSVFVSGEIKILPVESPTPGYEVGQVKGYSVLAIETE